MILPINDNYRIHGTRLCWQVEKLKINKKTGAEEYRAITWHATLKGAAESLAECMVRTAYVNTVADAVIEARRVAKLFSDALSLTVITQQDKARSV